MVHSFGYIQHKTKEMGLRLEIKKQLSARSDRVKSVDFHPTEPWLLVALYNGQVHIWNYENQASFCLGAPGGVSGHFLGSLRVP